MSKKTSLRWHLPLLLAIVLNLVMPHPDDSAKKVEYFLERPEGKAPGQL